MKNINVVAPISIESCANKLNVSVRTIRRYVSQGELIAYKIGGKIRFNQSDIDKYIRSQKIIRKGGRK